MRWVHPVQDWSGQEDLGQLKGVDAPWGSVGVPESREGSYL